MCEACRDQAQQITQAARQMHLSSQRVSPWRRLALPLVLVGVAVVLWRLATIEGANPRGDGPRPPHHLPAVPTPSLNTGPLPSRLGLPGSAGTFQDLSARIAPGVRLVVTQKGSHTAMGTGFVISPQGHLLTCDHLVSSGGQVVVLTSGEQPLPARVVWHDATNDLAIITVAVPTGTPLPLGDSEAVRPGSDIGVLGYPYGSELPELLGSETNVEPTVVRGVLSRRHRNVRQSDLPSELFELDVNLNPGISGGPVFETRTGMVIGVAAAELMGPEGKSGIGFAVPIKLALPGIAQVFREVPSAHVDRKTPDADPNRAQASQPPP